MPEEKGNVLRAQARRYAGKATETMGIRPRPEWNAACPPIPRRRYEEVKPMSVSPAELVSVIGRMSGRYGAES